MIFSRVKVNVLDKPWFLAAFRGASFRASGLPRIACHGIVPSVPIDYVDGEGGEFGASAELRTNRPEHRAGGKH